MNMKKLAVTVAVLGLLVSLLAVPVAAQETIATFSVREMTTAQKAFAGAGAVSVLLNVDDDAANLLPVLVAVGYELARPDREARTAEQAVESAVINVLLYYASRATTATLTNWLFGR